MKIKNAKLYWNGNFVDGGMEYGRTITDFGCDEGVDLQGNLVIPGLIDVHTHGAVGADWSDGDEAALPALAEYYAAHGVTSYVATTMTLKEPELIKAAKSVAALKRTEKGARCAGIHLEGPFISYEKRGAQNPDNLHAPDIDMFKRINEASGNRVRLITVAPEVDGALDFIREASKVCVVSLGHSTADFDTAMRGFEAGATHVTHLFNGMEPLHHRKPGLVGAALMANADVELICDGKHIHPAVINAAYRMFGERLVVVSDSLRCAGLPDGEYELGGLPIVMKDGLARLQDGTIAGSSTNLFDELRNLVAFGIPIEHAVFMMTEGAARSIGCFDAIGSLNIGKFADFLVVDRKLELKAVVIGGELVHGQL